VHIVWEFITFWYRCFEEGLISGKTALATIKNICGLITALVYLHRAVEPKWRELEKQIMLVSFCTYLSLIFYIALNVAPFHQYYAAKEMLREQESYEAMEKNRPRLDPVLFIDKINTNLEEVNYHFVIVNSGGLTAGNLRQHVRTTGNGHFHDWEDLFLKANTIDPNGRISFDPKPWNWEADDVFWSIQLTLTYQCIIADKVKNIKSSYEFRILRKTIKEGEFYPNHIDVDFDPPEPPSEATNFLEESDVKGDYILVTKGPLPPLSAFNSVRQFYVDTNRNMVRFYFRAENGHQVMLTNYYKAGIGATNWIQLNWDPQGAMLLVNSDFVGEPPIYWRKFLEDAGLKFDQTTELKALAQTFLTESDVKGIFGMLAEAPVEPLALSNSVRQFYIDTNQNTVRFYFRTENGYQVMLTNYYEPATNRTNFIRLDWDPQGAMLLVNSNIVADPLSYRRKVFEDAILRSAQNNFSKNFLAENDVKGAFSLSCPGVIPPLAVSNAVRQFYVDTTGNMVRFYFCAENGHQIMLTNYYEPGIVATNWIQAVWDPQGAMLLVNSNIVAEPRLYWRKILESDGIKFTP